MTQKKDKEEGIKLINLGNQPFRTSVGTLEPRGGELEGVPAEEAARILKYKGVHDASKYTPKPGKDAAHAALQKRATELEKANEKLEDANKKLEEHVEDLKAKLKEAKA